VWGDSRQIGERLTAAMGSCISFNVVYFDYVSSRSIDAWATH